MVDIIDYWDHLPNFLEDLKALSKQHKSETFTIPKGQQKPRSSSSSTSTFSVRNSVCIAGSDREAVLTLKREVYKLISGRCALESFHFRCDDDIRDGALFVPKVILVGVFQPGRKLIDDIGDDGQLDQVYDEIYQIGAEMMLVYMDLPKLVYPINTQNLYHVRLEKLMFPEQKVVKNLADHGLLLTLTENSRKLNRSQEQRMLEWLLRPVDPKTHPVFRTCALINTLCQKQEFREFHRSRNSFDSFFQGSYQNDNQDERFPHFSGFNKNYAERNINVGSDTQTRQSLVRSTSSDDDDDVDHHHMFNHGFMKSMESYPLLKRNSRKENKNNNKVFKNSSSHKYGSVKSKDDW